MRVQIKMTDERLRCCERVIFLVTSIESISNQERLNDCWVKSLCSVYLSKDWAWSSLDIAPNLPLRFVRA